MIRTLFLLLIFSVSAHAAEELQDLYAIDNAAFWSRWNQEKTAALTCDSIPTTSRFIAEAVADFSGSEVDEANANVIESLTLANSDCLMRAVAVLPSTDRTIFFRKFIVLPLFHSPAELANSLNKLWSTGQYKDLKSAFDLARDN